jgi:valyl-tRNA synthetase
MTSTFADPCAEEPALDPGEQPGAAYDHRVIEARWSARWENEGLFRADPRSGKPKFSLVLLPPCVSARLHLGHALQAIVQDVLVRYHRMAGFDVLWLPSLDFAPIATQRAVEKDLAAEGLTRHRIGREAFDERVRGWTQDNSAAIVAELRSLGASLDWDRLRYTMDAESVRSIRAAFVRLWDAGLVYQDFRVVNWCASCAAVLSNRQLVRKPRDRETHAFRVELDGGAPPLTVTTERPELLAAATAVIVDPRYVDFAPGRQAVLPVCGRTVPVIADAEACDAAGSRTFLLLAGHDPDHWTVGRRHGLEPLVGLDERNRLRAPQVPWLDGLTVADARETVLERLSTRLSGTTVRGGSVLLCELCDEEVEQVASLQWFVSMDSMAARARADHDEGRPHFEPARYNANYRSWLDGLHDWCVSRQLWLGPRVPVFTCSCGHRFAAVDDPEHCPACGAQGPQQETDVLDSWFSQAMWQATTLGWPDPEHELAPYYPTAITVGSRDGLRLGMSRMIMVGRELTGELPFETAVITCIVLRPDTRKMDGAKGTAIPASPYIESHGADALRGWAVLSAMTAENVAFDPSVITGWRRTVISLWNAVQLVLRDAADGSVASDDDQGSYELHRRWIFSRLGRLITVTTQSLESYELHRGAQALLEFIRGDLCSRYLHAIKPRLRAGDEQARQDALRVLDVVIRLLHPFLPFVTDELWQRLPDDRPVLERCDWPQAVEFPPDASAEEQMAQSSGRRRSGKRSRRRAPMEGTGQASVV